MDRRKFLGLFSAGVAGIALEQAIPLGRVWSFPKEIVIAKPSALICAYNQSAVRAFEGGLEIRNSIFFDAGLIDARMVREVSKHFTVAFPPGNSHTPS